MSKLLKLNDMLKLNAVKLSLPPAHPARPTYADQKTLFVSPYLLKQNCMRDKK